MRGQYAQAANKHVMKIGCSVDYVRSGGMRNVPVTKAVEHLYATTAKFSGCVLLASRPVYSYPPRRFIKTGVHCIQTKDSSRISAEQLTPLFYHPPYIPDLAPSDFYLLLKLKGFLSGKFFGSDEELENAVINCLNELAAEEYDMGILKLVDRYDKCLNIEGDYVEK
ncbi:hypothetical protein AVEN_48980-1 [Araneus ventricosus]|uniref:Histone-lysine N-methyltransferase SETMAR n=1 Tax=Araneus ventricosus TaxID=182803 RepID=A0A4Y2AIE4_ARAVE|nr:hypothetical protein AVEN_48980-1 [Araneus ventricosus]